MMEITITLMTAKQFREDADHNYVERLANSDNEEVGRSHETLPTIENAIGYLDQTDHNAIMVNQQTHDLVDELVADIPFGIGCAVQNAIENYCRFKYGATDEDMGDGAIEWINNLNGNDEEYFWIIAAQAVILNGGLPHMFTYRIEELRYVDWSDDNFIDSLLVDIRKYVDDVLRETGHDSN
jgi:hypothetical protein